MKAFIAEGTGAAQQLSGIQDEKIPIYGSKAAAEADIENLEENQIVATKENGFSSDGVYVVDSPAITGGDLIENSSMKIMFTSDIVGEDTSTPLSISWNGESYLVKVANNSQLQNIYAHEVSSGVFKYAQAYTTLELIFDGVQFVIVGNPLVLSSSAYSIYANGQNPYALSDIETITLSTNSSSPTEIQYDGELIVCSPYEGTTRLTINGITFDIVYAVTAGGGSYSKYFTIPVSKGDLISYTDIVGAGNSTFYARWYKERY